MTLMKSPPSGQSSNYTDTKVWKIKAWEIKLSLHSYLSTSWALFRLKGGPENGERRRWRWAGIAIFYQSCKPKEQDSQATC